MCFGAAHFESRLQGHVSFVILAAVEPDGTGTVAPGQRGFPVIGSIFSRTSAPARV